MSCVVPARERRSSQTPPAVCVLVGIVGSLPLFHRLLKREEALSHPLSSASSLSAFRGICCPPRLPPAASAVPRGDDRSPRLLCRRERFLTALDRRERPVPLQGISRRCGGVPAKAVHPFCASPCRAAAQGGDFRRSQIRHCIPRVLSTAAFCIQLLPMRIAAMQIVPKNFKNQQKLLISLQKCSQKCRFDFGRNREMLSRI